MTSTFHKSCKEELKKRRNSKVLTNLLENDVGHGLDILGSLERRKQSIEDVEKIMGSRETAQTRRRPFSNEGLVSGDIVDIPQIRTVDNSFEKIFNTTMPKPQIDTSAIQQNNLTFQGQNQKLNGENLTPNKAVDETQEISPCQVTEKPNANHNSQAILDARAKEHFSARSSNHEGYS